MRKRILVIDDDPDVCILLSMFLSKNGYKTASATTGDGGIAKCKQFDFDAVFCDYWLGDKNGADVLIELKKINPKVVVVIISGNSDVKTAVEMIKYGAVDYLSKPLHPDEILKTLDWAFADPSLQNGNSFHLQNRAQDYSLLPDGSVIITHAASSKELYQQVKLAANAEDNIILRGESGTGKEVIAGMIHGYSKGNEMPFVAINGGLPGGEFPGGWAAGNLMEDMLVDKTDHFELADGSTLYIYGLADLSPDEQAALLTMIRERKLKMPGLQKEIHIKSRIIIAWVENPGEAGRQGHFMEELFQLLNGFSISLPALKNRKEDILPFADFFLHKANTESGKNIEGFDDEVADLFYNYEWPGNLRELKNVIRRAVLLLGKGKIGRQMLPPEIVHAAFRGERQGFQVKVEERGLLEVFRLKRMKTEAEYQVIADVLRKVNQNKTKAAEILKVDRKTLYNKIKAYHDIT